MSNIFCRTAGSGIQVQAEEDISVELIEEREKAIRQLEVCEKKICSLCLPPYCWLRRVLWLTQDFRISMGQAIYIA